MGIDALIAAVPIFIYKSIDKMSEERVKDFSDEKIFYSQVRDGAQT